ncbi:hypothetical protein, partial [Pseudomonas syringae group genomosp. 7]|uniref:hypothetical protein n=1 Tax=Pseudomonas syringae group genomosp. 7 TaxID=251699 RepID=UPI00376FAC3C
LRKQSSILSNATGQKKNSADSNNPSNHTYTNHPNPTSTNHPHRTTTLIFIIQKGKCAINKINFVLMVIF